MLALDHIVFAGMDAERASARYGNQFAIKAVKGGQHDHWGTYNYLAYFSNNSYLEWLGVYNEDKIKEADNPLIQHLDHFLEQGGRGPFQFALRTNQMDKYLAHFEKNNIPYQGPFPGKREKPDGTMLKWRMLFPAYDVKKEMLPFLIEWDRDDDKQMVTSLLNPQAITKISYGGTNRARFRQIYQLKAKSLYKNHFPLTNSKITFTDQTMLSFDLV